MQSQLRGFIAGIMVGVLGISWYYDQNTNKTRGTLNDTTRLEKQSHNAKQGLEDLAHDAKDKAEDAKKAVDKKLNK
jgi:endoglucanase Acf2